MFYENDEEMLALLGEYWERKEKEKQSSAFRDMCSREQFCAVVRVMAEHVGRPISQLTIRDAERFRVELRRGKTKRSLGDQMKIGNTELAILGFCKFRRERLASVAPK